MDLIKNKKVQIKMQAESYLVRCRQMQSTPGAYAFFDLKKNTVYRILVNHGKFNGNVRLWIATPKNKPILFHPKFFLRTRHKLEYSFNSGNFERVKIGLLFVNPALNNFYFLKDIKVEEINKPPPKRRLAILVPYRDRKIHMTKFVPYMNNYLKGFNYQIILVHQKNKKLFNRAALFNIGFDIIKGNFDYFCFHDVDLLPEAADYSFPKNPAHLSMYCSQFNYKRKDIFGGVTLFTKRQFLKINGFSNQFKGWGGEDDDLRVRVKRFYKPEYRPGKYKSLPHKHVGHTNPNYEKNVDLYEKRLEKPELSDKDGLSNIKDGRFKYRLLRVHQINNNGSLKLVDNITYKNGENFMVDVDF